MAVDSVGDEIKIDPDEKVNKNISGSENKVFPKENVTAGNGEVRKADRGSRKQKSLNDDYVNDTADRHVEQEKAKVRKIDKATTNGVIISARALLRDANNVGQLGMYIGDMEFEVKKVPEKKRTNRFVDWASEKKNSLSKIFSRFHSKK